jgi:aryl-alcohol dehydrogenase-like predicted oxidoreductase
MKDKLIFGTAQLTSMRSYSEIKNLLNHVRDNGIDVLDTARMYGGGYCELLLGKYLRKNKGSFNINTKVGLGSIAVRSVPIKIALPIKYYLKKYINKIGSNKKEKDLLTVNEFTLNRNKFDLNYIQRSFEVSYKLLGIEQIHTLLLHECLPKELTDESLDFLFKLREQGRVQYLGIGADARKIKHSEYLGDFDVCQYQFAYYDELKSQYSDLRHNCFGVLSGNSTPRQELLKSAVEKIQQDDKIIFNTSKVDRIPKQNEIP